MQAKDVRAVENPITAIFDLAEDVEKVSPKITRLLRYTRVFVWVFLLLDAVLTVLFPEFHPLKLLLLLLLYGLLLLLPASTNLTVKGAVIASSFVVAGFLVLTFRTAFLVGLAFVALFVLGMVILDLIRDARSFFGYYAMRYRVIRAVREADPIILVPQGATPVDRLLAALAQRSPAIAGMLAHPQNVRKPAIATGRSGVAYQFDALLTWPSGTLAPFGVGATGGSVFVKAFERAPTRMDLEALRRAVEDVAVGMRLPPTRVVAVWKSDGASIGDDAYAFLTTETVRVPTSGRVRACSIELATEMPDGTYDFIPLVVEPWTAPPAGSPAAGPAWS